MVASLPVDLGPELRSLPTIGEAVDRYRIVARIGLGGMAVVYAVRRSSIGGFEKLLAMKVMLPNLALDARFVNMFLDEARIASHIQHKNVVEVLDVGTWNELPFLVMELLSGRSFSHLLSALGDTPDARVPVALAVLAQAAEGLHAAHEALGADGKSLEVVHRDVSPQNIFVTADGEVKVVDFGVAAARGRLSDTRTGELKGKLRYLAPEQVTLAHPLTRAADIWSLGVVAWEAFTGRRLFTEANEATALWNIVEAPIEDVAALAPSLPAACAAMVRRCLERDPAQRPKSAQEIGAVFAKGARDLAGPGGVDLAGALANRFGDALARERTMFADVARDVAALDAGADAEGDASGTDAAKADALVPAARTALTTVTEVDTPRSQGEKTSRRGAVTLLVAAATATFAAVVAFRGSTAPAATAPASPATPASTEAKTSPKPDALPDEDAALKATSAPPPAPSPPFLPAAPPTASAATRSRSPSPVRRGPKPASSAPMSNPLIKNPF